MFILSLQAEEGDSSAAENGNQWRPSTEIQAFNDSLTDVSAEEMAQASRGNSGKKSQHKSQLKRPREESTQVKAAKDWKKKAKLPKNL